MKFEELNLPDFISKSLEKNNFTDATEIQEKTIPLILGGKDVVGKSKTGSGKTFAYGIPALSLCDSSDKLTQALVVCPTRELVVQVTEELRKLTEFKEGLAIVSVFGGNSITRQIQALKRNAKIIVGTPGRLCDHIMRKTIKLKNLKLLVLDEADEMLDMGFKEDMEKIINETNPYRQTVMFSATMSPTVLNIAKTYMKNTEYIEINKSDENLDIKQYFVYVDEKDKQSALMEILTDFTEGHSLIFCNTKRMTEKLSKFMKASGYSAEALNGDMNQGDRKKALDALRNGKINFLIATDVAARGIDVSGLDAVFNFDIPEDTDYYTHRIGRTGRAGKTGLAYTLINNRYHLRLLDIIKQKTKNEITEYKCKISKEVPNIGKVVAADGEGSFRRSRKSSGAKRGSYGKRSERSEGASSERRYKRSEDGGFKERSFRPRKTEDGSFNSESNALKNETASENVGGVQETRSDKPNEKFGDRKYGEKKFGDGERKTSYRSAGGERKYGDKKFGDRKFGDGERKTSYRSADGERKFGDKTYGEKKFGDGEHKTSYRSAGGERKFGDKKFGDKKYGEKKFGDSEHKTTYHSADGEKRRAVNADGTKTERSFSTEKKKDYDSKLFTSDKRGSYVEKHKSEGRPRRNYSDKPDDSGEIKFREAGKSERH